MNATSKIRGIGFGIAVRVVVSIGIVGGGATASTQINNSREAPAIYRTIDNGTAAPAINPTIDNGTVAPAISRTVDNGVVVHGSFPPPVDPTGVCPLSLGNGGISAHGFFPPPVDPTSACGVTPTPTPIH